MKVLFVGLWVTLVALGSAYGAAMYNSGAEAPGKPSPPVVVQSQQTRAINVPIISDGQLHGYMVAQFDFTIDAAAAKTLAVPPEVYLLDEAFRSIYSDTVLDPSHVERYDLKKLTAHLLESTNAHLGAPLIKEVLIANFSYVEKEGDKT